MPNNSINKNASNNTPKPLPLYFFTTKDEQYEAKSNSIEANEIGFKIGKSRAVLMKQFAPVVPRSVSITEDANNNQTQCCIIM